MRHSVSGVRVGEALSSLRNSCSTLSDALRHGPGTHLQICLEAVTQVPDPLVFETRLGQGRPPPSSWDDTYGSMRNRASRIQDEGSPAVWLCQRPGQEGDRRLVRKPEVVTKSPLWRGFLFWPMTILARACAIAEWRSPPPVCAPPVCATATPLLAVGRSHSIAPSIPARAHRLDAVRRRMRRPMQPRRQARWRSRPRRRGWWCCAATAQ